MTRAPSNTAPAGKPLFPGSLLHRLRIAFSIDLRSLALFRIALATVILVDLFLRAFDISDFYTDQGVLTRALWPKSTHFLHWSLHAASGQYWYQLLLFVLAAVFAFCLLVGYRSRLMAVLSWVMLQSLVNRNVYLASGGDDLLVILAFWSMFLPLGARCSVDAAFVAQHRHSRNVWVVRAEGEDGNRFFSLVTVAVLLQVMYLYFFTALLKTGDAWRLDFDAAWWAVSLQHYSTPIGLWLSNFPTFLKFSTAAVLVMELVAIFTIFSPWYHLPLRLLTLIGLYALHASFLLMLYIGLFPVVDFTALALLIPGAVWVWLGGGGRTAVRAPPQNIQLLHLSDDEIARKRCLLIRQFLLPGEVMVQATDDIAAATHRNNGRGWAVEVDGVRLIDSDASRFLFSHRWYFRYPSALLRLLPLAWLARLWHGCWQRIAGIATPFSGFLQRARYANLALGPRWYTRVVALFFLYVVTVVNLATVKPLNISKPWHVIVAEKITRLDQRWDMFAPYPLRVSIYPVLVGTLRDGSEVDLRNWREHPADWAVPDNMYAVYGGYRWRKYFGRMSSSKSKTAKTGLGSWLCRQWNHSKRAHERQLVTADVHFVKIHSRPEEKDKPVRKYRAWHHWCFAEFAPADRK